MQRFETGDSDHTDPNNNNDNENKTDTRRNFALIGGVVVAIVVAVYIIASVYPSQIFSQAQDKAPVEQQVVEVNVHPVLPASPLKTSSQALFNSTDEVFGKLFRQMGKTYTKPALQLYQDTITAGGCGYVKPATGPFYCAADKEIYIDIAFFASLQKRFTSASKLTQAYAIAHQAGHHIQHLLGTTDKVEAQQGKLSEDAYGKLVDKLELQADFYAGVWAHYAYKGTIEQADAEIALSAATQIGNDLEQMNDRTMPDSFSHSTIADRTRWFNLGYTSGDMSKGSFEF
ncbi:MAG: neutral zinc metallopeptidase [Mucilaginibacter sp.]